MKNNFAEIYTKKRALEARFRAAQEQHDEAAVAQARCEHKALEAQVQEAGPAYARLYRLYVSAMERGNAYIDLSEVHDYCDEAALISDMRAYGIDKFTLSSGWSSAIESAWRFTQNGCMLEGMIEINDGCRDFTTGACEKCGALLFRVQEG